MQTFERFIFLSGCKFWPDFLLINCHSIMILPGTTAPPTPQIYLLFMIYKLLMGTLSFSVGLHLVLVSTPETIISNAENLSSMIFI